MLFKFFKANVINITKKATQNTCPLDFGSLDFFNMMELMEVQRHYVYCRLPNLKQHKNHFLRKC